MTKRYERERQSSVWTVLVTILFAAVAVVGTIAVVAPGVAVGQSPSPPAPIDGVVSQWTDGEPADESPASAGSEDKTGTVGSLETDSDDEGGDGEAGGDGPGDTSTGGDDGGGSDASDSGDEDESDEDESDDASDDEDESDEDESDDASDDEDDGDDEDEDDDDDEDEDDDDGED